MANDLVENLTNYRKGIEGAAGAIAGAAEKLTPITDAIGLTTPKAALPSQGYNRDGSPPPSPVKQTPTGPFETQNFDNQ